MTENLYTKITEFYNKVNDTYWNVKIKVDKTLDQYLPEMLTTAGLGTVGLGFALLFKDELLAGTLTTIMGQSVAKLGLEMRHYENCRGPIIF